MFLIIPEMENMISRMKSYDTNVLTLYVYCSVEQPFEQEKIYSKTIQMSKFKMLLGVLAVLFHGVRLQS